MTSSRFLLLSGLLTVLAIILRLHNIDVQPIWLDEAFTYLFSLTPNYTQLQLTEVNPPLFYLIHRLWLPIAGDSPLALRLPSAVFFLISAAGIIFYGRRILGTTTSLILLVLLTLSPYHLYYSQEARSYALLINLDLLMILALFDSLKHNNPYSRAIFSLSLLLLFFTHYTSLLQLPALVAVIYLYARSIPGCDKTSAWIALLLPSFLIFLWGIFSFHHLTSFDSHGWVSDVQHRHHRAEFFFHSIQALLFGPSKEITDIYFKQYSQIVSPVETRVIYTLIILSFFFAALVILKKSLSPKPLFNSLIILFLGPLFLLFAASFFKPVLVTGRYDAIAFAPCLLLMAATLNGSIALAKNTRLFPIVFIAITSLAILDFDRIQSHFSETAKLEHATHREKLLEVIKQNELVILPGYSLTNFRYQMARNNINCQSQHCTQPDGRQFFYHMLPIHEGHLVFDLDNPQNRQFSFNQIFEKTLDTIDKHSPNRVWVLLPRQDLAHPNNKQILRDLSYALKASGYKLENIDYITDTTRLASYLSTETD